MFFVSLLFVAVVLCS